jgi:hypothetical protein
MPWLKGYSGPPATEQNGHLQSAARCSKTESLRTSGTEGEHRYVWPLLSFVNGMLRRRSGVRGAGEKARGPTTGIQASGLASAARRRWLGSTTVLGGKGFCRVCPVN